MKRCAERERSVRRELKRERGRRTHRDAKSATVQKREKREREKRWRASERVPRENKECSEREREKKYKDGKERQRVQPMVCGGEAVESRRESPREMHPNQEAKRDLESYNP